MGKANPTARKTDRRANTPRKTARPRGGLQKFVGMFASRTGDLAVRHDDFLYGWKKQEP